MRFSGSRVQTFGSLDDPQAMDAVGDATIVVQMFVRQPAQNASIGTGLEHGVGILAEFVAHLSQPVFQVGWVTAVIVRSLLQSIELSHESAAWKQ